MTMAYWDKNKVVLCMSKCDAILLQTAIGLAIQSANVPAVKKALGTMMADIEMCWDDTDEPTPQEMNKYFKTNIFTPMKAVQ